MNVPDPASGLFGRVRSTGGTVGRLIVDELLLTTPELSLARGDLRFDDTGVLLREPRPLIGIGPVVDDTTETGDVPAVPGVPSVSGVPAVANSKPVSLVGVGLAERLLGRPPLGDCCRDM